jgi:hypothetical protein
MPYIGTQPTQQAFVTDTFNGNGSTTAFTMSVAPANTASVLVAVSGVLQAPSTYSVSGLTLTFTGAPPTGTGNISCRYLGIPASGVTTTAYRTVTEFTATAGQTTFTPPSYTAGFISVYRNGVMLGSADYTATNGTTVVLTTGATSGDLVTVESFYVSSVLNAIPNTAGSVSSSNIQTSPTITTPTINKINTSVANTSLGAGNASIMKNRIINGAMVISQYNGTSSVTIPSTGSQYVLDRWSAASNNASKYSVQQNAGSVTPPTGFTNYLGVTSLAATTIAAGDYYFLVQKIEGYNIADLGWGTANAKTVTLSFQVYSSLTGTFGGSIQASGSTRTYPFSYTISSANTWTSISVTIAGDTTGTWLTTNGVGIQVFFGLGIGSTYSGTAGVWSSTNYISVTGATSVVGTNGATFYLTAVQIEVGSSATGFEYVNYQTSLANCQRYYAKTFPQSVAPAQNAGTGGTLVQQDSGNAGFGSQLAWRFPVTMRATPSTITTYNPSAANANIRNTATNTDSTVVASNVGASDSGYNIVSGTAGTAGQCLAVHITASAEL